MRVPDFSTRTPAQGPPVWDLALAAAGILAVALCAGAIVEARTEAAAVREGLAEVRREIAGLERQASSLERRAGEGPTGQAWLTAEAPPPLVLAELGDLLPPDVRLAGLSLGYGRTLEIEMRVVARSPGAYDRLLERLEASPRLKDLSLGAESREGEVETTVRASFVTERPRP
ncbi:MAG TPA: hypothetical protein VLI67_06630 [Vicinamibacteria bacterium]|nr:hypothetical protein [Vicinamibacteria bacterium]